MEALVAGAIRAVRMPASFYPRAHLNVNVAELDGALVVRLELLIIITQHDTLSVRYDVFCCQVYPIDHLFWRRLIFDYHGGLHLLYLRLILFVVRLVGVVRIFYMPVLISFNEVYAEAV